MYAVPLLLEPPAGCPALAVGPTPTSLLTVAQVLDAGLAHSRGGAVHVRKMRNHVGRFMDFLHECAPEICLWSQVNAGLMRQFVYWCEENAMTARTVRAYINPLRLAARYFEEHGGDQQNLRFTRIVPATTPCERRFLTAPRLVQAIAYCRANREHTALLAFALGGVCGLRIAEISRLDRSHLDVLAPGQLYIEDSKNYWSTRLIPLPEPIANYLRRWFEFQGEAVTITQEGLGQAVTRALVRCSNVYKDETFAMIKPKDACRKSALNLIIDAGAEKMWAQAYVGHAPETTYERSYADLRPSPSDLPDFRDRKLENLRKHVSVPVAEHLTKLGMVL